MKKFRIVADDKIPFLKESPLAELTDLLFLPGAAISRRDLMHADALITRTRTKCNAALLDGTPVRMIATATIGFDHIDREYCAGKGIRWNNAPGCNADSVAQYLTSLLVVHAEKTGTALAGKTIGIVGVGNVGSRVAKVAQILGLHVLLNDPPRQKAENNNLFVPLEQIQREADFISFHVPLQKQGEFRTEALADENFFRNLRRAPFLINSSRGEVVCGEALKDALRKGAVSGAALDVWEHEPDIDRDLMNLLEFATPHIAGYSADGKANGTRACVENIARFFHLRVERIDRILPPAPCDPVIDLDQLEGDRVAGAILRTFHPLPVDKVLRATPERFEWFRANYDHPREYPAFRVLHASDEEAATFRAFGFQLDI